MQNKESKVGKYCPFRDGHKCGGFCGLWNEGLKACNLIGINMNIGTVVKELQKLNKFLDSMPKESEE